MLRIGSFRYCPDYQCHGPVTKGQALAAYRASGGQHSSTVLEDRPLHYDRAYDYADSPYPDGGYDGYPDSDHADRDYSDRDFPGELVDGLRAETEARNQPDDHLYQPDEYEAPVSAAVEVAGPGRRGMVPSPNFRSRAVFAAVTLGAITAAAAGQSLLPHHSPKLNIEPSAQPRDVAVVLTTDGNSQQSLEVPPAPRVVDAAAQVAQLTATQHMTGEVSTAAYVKPADGSVISGFGGSYGTMHYGIEIAGSKDAPIYAAAAGTIVAAGPASGFGMWVKEQLADGTMLVYARMDDFSVQVGQQVTAGQQIARMGDRGFSTGYTLHFEVWNTAGKKVDPEQWLNQRGIIL